MGENNGTESCRNIFSDMRRRVALREGKFIGPEIGA
jgi:hypothetical protein